MSSSIRERTLMNPDGFYDPTLMLTIVDMYESTFRPKEILLSTHQHMNDALRKLSLELRYGRLDADVHDEWHRIVGLLEYHIHVYCRFVARALIPLTHIVLKKTYIIQNPTPDDPSPTALDLKIHVIHALIHDDPISSELYTKYIGNVVKTDMVDVKNDTMAYSSILKSAKIRMESIVNEMEEMMHAFRAIYC